MSLTEREYRKALEADVKRAMKAREKAKPTLSPASLAWLDDQVNKAQSKVSDHIARLRLYNEVIGQLCMERKIAWPRPKRS